MGLISVGWAHMLSGSVQVCRQAVAAVAAEAESEQVQEREEADH